MYVLILGKQETENLSVRVAREMQKEKSGIYFLWGRTHELRNHRGYAVVSSLQCCRKRANKVKFISQQFIN